MHVGQIKVGAALHRRIETATSWLYCHHFFLSCSIVWCDHKQTTLALSVKCVNILAGFIVKMCLIHQQESH